MKKVLVTGANGQLGKCLQQAARQFPGLEFDFFERGALDITDPKAVKAIFENGKYGYCINAAAYTNVDQAEKEPKKAFLVNAEAVKNLAIQCDKQEVVLLQVSTDYVFDGKKAGAYVESDATNPINVYGASKLKGEAYVQEFCERHFIVRASWVYSEFGHNFLKSILRLAKERDTLTITTSQVGSPTNAHDLATVLLKIVTSESESYGIYHFCNTGKTTWHDFAKAIVKHAGLSDKTTVVKTDDYPTFAERPKNSVLSTKKLETKFGIAMEDWKNRLQILV